MGLPWLQELEHTIYCHWISYWAHHVGYEWCLRDDLNWVLWVGHEHRSAHRILELWEGLDQQNVSWISSLSFKIDYLWEVPFLPFGSQDLKTPLDSLARCSTSFQLGRAMTYVSPAISKKIGAYCCLLRRIVTGVGGNKGWQKHSSYPQSEELDIVLQSSK